MLVLIADDETVSRKVLQRAVEQLGHKCLLAKDGEEAWELASEHHPDVIISDWMMPRLDGVALCRRVREGRLTGYTYFVLLTALSRSEHRLQGIQAGADDYLTKPLDTEELALRLIAARRVTSLHRKLVAQTAQLERLNQQFYQDGRRDPLTGIGNRRRMEEDLLKLHAQATRYGHRYALALVDVDDFKKYNDTCGHPAGDETLCAVAEALSEACRTADSVYRYGGEEFLAVFPEAEADGAVRAAERMRAQVEGLALPHPGKTPAGTLTVSAGVAVLPVGEGVSWEEIVRRADQALYRAKQRGRNRVARWEPGG